MVCAASDPLIAVPVWPATAPMLHQASQSMICSRNASQRSPDFFPVAPGRFRQITKHIAKNNIESAMNNGAMDRTGSCLNIQHSLRLTEGHFRADS